jgi:hypothetical protein
MGYSYEGMQKLTKERALELFEQGFDVYRLYSDGTEGLCQRKEDKLDDRFYDNEFGIETGNYEKLISGYRFKNEKN